MNKQKLQLCHDLHEFLESKEQTNRQSRDLEKKRAECVNVLEEIESFLVAWSEFEDPSGLPDMRLKKTISWTVSVLGPGDPQLRDHLWDTLVATGSSTACRLVVLDFLSVTIPTGTNEDERLELVRILKQVFNDDSNLVGPVLECLDSIYEAGGLEKRDIFQFGLDMLPKEHESRIHLIIKFLVKHVSSDKTARTVVEAMRVELQAIEETPSFEAFVLPTCLLFYELWNIKETNGFFNTYLDVLGASNLDGEENSRVLVVDMVVLLLANTESKYHSAVQGIVDGNLLDNYIASELPCLLLHDGIWKELRTPLLLESLGSLCTTALSAPFRTTQMENLEKNLDTTKQFIRLVFRAFRDTGDASTRLTVSLINLANEAIKAAEKGNSDNSPDASTIKVVHSVCTCIFSSLNMAVSEGPGSLVCPKLFLRKNLVLALSNAQHHDLTLVQVCEILCKLEDSDGQKIETKAVFQVLQTLLFCPTTPVPNGEIQTHQKCRAGFLLALSIIENMTDLDENSISNIWKMLKSMLLPPSKSMGNTSIGLLGLDVGRKLCYSTRTSASIKKQVFHTITHMVSKTKLIQYATNFEDRRRQHIALAYADQVGGPKAQKNSPKSRKIIFCCHSIVQDDILLDSSSWMGVSEYVLTLIDTYLAIGRQPKDSASSWTPKPWIEGAIELPLVDLTELKNPTTNKKSLCDQLKEDMNRSIAISPPNNTEKVLVDLTKNIKTDVDFNEIMLAMVRLTLSLIVSQAISVAVINNTFEQYEAVLNGAVLRDKRIDSLQLIHFQLAKLYDLRKRTKTMQKLLKTLVSRKSGKRNGPKRKRLKISRLSNNDLVESAIGHMGSIVHSLFCRVRPKMLWNAVTDTFHDQKLIEHLDSNTRGVSVLNSTSDRHAPLLEVVEMRLKAQEHLSLHFDDMREISSMRLHRNSLQLIFDQGPLPVVARCLRLASFLSLRLAVLDDDFDTILVEKLAQLTASYFGLISSATALLLEVQGEQMNPRPKSFWNLLDLFSSFLGSKTPLQIPIAIEDDPTAPSPKASIQTLISSCRSHLSSCHFDLVRYELLESLSVFCIELGDDAIVDMLDVSEDFLHSQLRGSSIRNHPPYSLRLATERLIASVSAEERALVQSLLGFDSRTGLLKSASRDPSTTFGMLRHWGLLALGSRQSVRLETYIHRLLSNVTSFLGGASDPIANEEPPGPNEASVEYSTERTTKRVESTTDSFIPGLSKNSFVVYFELTLQIIIASTSVFSISNERQAHETQHPFDHLTKLFEIYGASIELYLNRHDAFPIQTLQVIVKSSRDILKSANTKVHSCMRWRNLQPVVLVHDIDSKKDDVASPQHLKRLIDAVSNNVISRIQSICKELPRLDTFRGHGSLQKLKSLRAQAERLQVELLKTSSILHLSDTEYDQASAPVAAISKLYQNTNGPNGPNVDLWSQNQSPRKRARPMISLPIGFDKMQGEDISLSSEQSQDTSSSSNGSKDFGASGNWGEDSDEMSESCDEIMLKSKWIQVDDE